MTRRAAGKAEENQEPEVPEVIEETPEEGAEVVEETTEESSSKESNEDTEEKIEVEYKVRRGETLWGIAGFFGVDVDELAKLNGIEDINKVKAGDVLKINSDVPEEDLYRVVRGETLTSIARKFDTDVDTLVDLNGLENENKIAAGQVLRIREGK